MSMLLPSTGAEEGVVPVGKRAARGARGQVGPEPLLLCRPGGAGTRLPDGAGARGGALGVDRNDVPARSGRQAQVIAVVALRALAGGPGGVARAVEVVEVAGRGRLVLVVPRDRPRDRAHPAPARVV